MRNKYWLKGGISLGSPSPIVDGGAVPSSQVSPWSELNHDLLLSIFSRLSCVDLIVGVSTVCSSWRAAARERHLWRILDFSELDSVSVGVKITFGHVLSRVLRFVGKCDLVEEVYFPTLADEVDPCCVSERLPKLIYLSFPRTEIRNPLPYYALVNFASLKGITVHKRFFLKHRYNFSNLKFPQVTELKVIGETTLFGNYITKMICKVFPNLRKLEMPQLLHITDMTVTTLLGSFEHLEYLDISE